MLVLKCHSIPSYFLTLLNEFVFLSLFSGIPGMLADSLIAKFQRNISRAINPFIVGIAVSIS